MRHLLPTITDTLKMFKKDKVILLLSFFPVLIGILLFYFFGDWFYSIARGYFEGLITQYVTNEGAFSVLKWIVNGIIFILLYFVVGYTFVLIVSIIASPFNDGISSRVEKIMGGQVPEKLPQTFKNIFKNAPSAIGNQIKKVGFIILLATFALLLNLVPLLTPVSLFISALLMAIEFIDYSWERHDLKFRSCVANLMKNSIPYALVGGGFMALMTVPVINLMALPLGVIYFTILWTKQNPKKMESTL